MIDQAGAAIRSGLWSRASGFDVANRGRDVIRAIAAILPLLALCACGLPPSPQRTDPYQGLLPAGQSPPRAAETLPIAARDKSVALVVSNSTEQQFAYVEAYLKELHASTIMKGFGPDGDRKLRPQYLVGETVRTLKQHFATVDLVDDFNQALARKADYVALLDMSIELPTAFVHQYRYAITVDLLTKRIERIGALHGESQEGFWCPNDPDCALAVNVKTIDEAVAQFGAEADAGLR